MCLETEKMYFIGTGVFVIIEYFIYINTESQSIYRLLKYINICNLFRINTIYMEYINVNVFSHVVSLRYVLITAVIMTVSYDVYDFGTCLL